MNNAGIRVKYRYHCPVCTSSGKMLYSNLTDKIFRVPGEWNIYICKDTSCKTLWLNPTPEESDLPKLYTNYYTHTPETFPTSTPSAPTSLTPMRSLLSHIRFSYLDHAYGYKNPSKSIAHIFLWPIAYIHPAWKDTQAADIFYLQAKSDGALLDVGCGGGRTMQLMKNRGWHVTGVDFDENAIKNAKSKGLDARLGELSSQNFADETFDAITMGHVLEHVPFPLELIRECRRILKKGGVLVITTPNANSPGSHFYGKDWRGLEVPRHLQVFTNTSLTKIVQYAGFSSIKSFTSMQSDMYIWKASRELHKKGKHNMLAQTSFGDKIFTHFLNFVIGWINVLAPGHSEVAVVICRK